MKSMNIETHVLVATDDEPQIIQGFFHITSNKSDQKQTYLFKASCHDAKNNNDFDPILYQFCELYIKCKTDEIKQIPIDNHQNSDMLYILSFALHQTIVHMMQRNKYKPSYIDAQATESLAAFIKDKLTTPCELMDNSEIGFAVSIPFSPTDDIGFRIIDKLLTHLPQKFSDSP
jgi:hypothetical protein